MSNEYKEWLKEQSFESLANDNLRMKLELKTAKEENENLKKLIRKLAIDKIEFDRLKRNETDKVDYSFGQIEKLTQQNKQMREYIGKAEDIARTYQDYRPCLLIKKELQQALNEVNNEK